MTDLRSNGRASGAALGTPQPRLRRGETKSDVVPSGPVETFKEQDERRWFLENLYGKQEPLPRDKRSRRVT